METAGNPTSRETAEKPRDSRESDKPRDSRESENRETAEIEEPDQSPWLGNRFQSMELSRESFSVHLGRREFSGSPHFAAVSKTSWRNLHRQHESHTHPTLIRQSVLFRDPPLITRKCAPQKSKANYVQGEFTPPPR